MRAMRLGANLTQEKYGVFFKIGALMDQVDISICRLRTRSLS